MSNRETVISFLQRIHDRTERHVHQLKEGAPVLLLAWPIVVKRDGVYVVFQYAEDDEDEGEYWVVDTTTWTTTEDGHVRDVAVSENPWVRAEPMACPRCQGRRRTSFDEYGDCPRCLGEGFINELVLTWLREEAEAEYQRAKAQLVELQDQLGHLRERQTPPVVRVVKTAHNDLSGGRFVSCIACERKYCQQYSG